MVWQFSQERKKKRLPAYIRPYTGRINKIGSFIIKLIMKSIKCLIVNAPEFQRIIHTIVIAIITTRIIVLIIIRSEKCHSGNQSIQDYYRNFCKGVRFSFIV